MDMHPRSGCGERRISLAVVGRHAAVAMAPAAVAAVDPIVTPPAAIAAAIVLRLYLVK